MTNDAAIKSKKKMSRKKFYLELFYEYKWSDDNYMNNYLDDMMKLLKQFSETVIAVSRGGRKF